ncbi:MAG: amidohydrolase family protein [Fibrobacteria bacterium]|nr:amidohydrolase family protein [Fibrobacteria bacterium]
MVIDMHCHTAGIGAGGSGCFAAKKLIDSYKFKIYLKAFNVSRKELEEKGDGLVIQRLAEKLDFSKKVDGAIVLALDGVIDSLGNLDSSKTEVYVPNEFLARETAKYPKLYFGASVNPHRPDALERLEKWKREGTQLIKWLPSIQNIDPSDSSIIPFYQKLIELNLPLLTHTGAEKSFTHSRNELCDPARLKLPLELGVTVIAAHVATTGKSEGERNHERLIAMIPKYPTLYTDISSLTQLNKKFYVKKILKHKEIHAKLLYGTDIPLINTILVSPWYFPIQLSFKQIREVNSHDNMWDRDVTLKRALGVPDSAFTRAYHLFPMSRKTIMNDDIGIMNDEL